LLLESILIGDLATAREVFAVSPLVERLMCDLVHGPIDRVEAADHCSELSDADLRGWQFVITRGHRSTA
jgi:hypothetical protein